MFSPVLPYVVPTTMIDVIKHLGLETSLQWVVDAGDINSIADGSDQTLGTIPAGGTTFTRGPNTTVDADRDPVFTGTPGGQSANEYWATNANATSYKRLQSPAATWSNNAHKDGALFTFAGWFYVPSAVTNPRFFGTTGSNTDYTTTGILIAGEDIGANPTRPYYAASNGSGATSAIEVPATVISMPKDEAFFAAWSMDEAANSLMFVVNDDTETVAGAYTSPSSSGSTYEPTIFAVTGTNTTFSRVYNASWWNRALSSAELLSIYNATKAKFGH